MITEVLRTYAMRIFRDHAQPPTSNMKVPQLS